MPPSKKPNAEQPLPPYATVIGLASLIILIFAGCNALFAGEEVPAINQIKYDECFEEKRSLGVGLIKADEICSFWKYQWKP